jgi:hypothetical protein
MLIQILQQMNETGSKTVDWIHPAQDSVQSEPSLEGFGAQGEAFFAGGSPFYGTKN